MANNSSSPLTYSDKPQPMVTAVDVLIADITQNKVLCVLRSQTDPILGGMWALPGGVVEKEESHHQTAQRELMEELNVKIKNISEKPILEDTFDLKTLTLHLFVYSAELEDPSTLRANASDIAEVKWLYPQELLASISKFQAMRKGVKGLKDMMTNLGLRISR